MSLQVSRSKIEIYFSENRDKRRDRDQSEDRDGKERRRRRRSVSRSSRAEKITVGGNGKHGPRSKAFRLQDFRQQNVFKMKVTRNVKNGEENVVNEKNASEPNV